MGWKGCLWTRVCSDIVRLPNQPTLWFIEWSQMERLKQWFLDFINWMIWHYIPPRQYPESQVQTFENAPIYCHWSDGSAIRLACPINIKISHFYNVMQEWLDQMPRSAYSHEFVSLCPPSPNVTFYNVTNFTRQHLINHVWMDGASETVGWGKLRERKSKVGKESQQQSWENWTSHHCPPIVPQDYESDKQCSTSI